MDFANELKDKKCAVLCCSFFIDNRCMSYLSLDFKEHTAVLSIIAIIMTTASVSLSCIVIVIVWTPPIHKDAPSSSTVSAARASSFSRCEDKPGHVDSLHIKATSFSSPIAVIITTVPTIKAAILPDDVLAGSSRSSSTVSIAPIEAVIGLARGSNEKHLPTSFDGTSHS